jgi:hypothetical protein
MAGLGCGGKGFAQGLFQGARLGMEERTGLSVSLDISGYGHEGERYRGALEFLVFEVGEIWLKTLFAAGEAL